MLSCRIFILLMHGLSFLWLRRYLMPSWYLFWTASSGFYLLHRKVQEPSENNSKVCWWESYSGLRQQSSSHCILSSESLKEVREQGDFYQELEVNNHCNFHRHKSLRTQKKWCVYFLMQIIKNICDFFPPIKFQV